MPARRREAGPCSFSHRRAIWRARRAPRNSDFGGEVTCPIVVRKLLQRADALKVMDGALGPLSSVDLLAVAHLN